MRAYILTDKDFAKLLAEIDRNPQHGANGGSSCVLSAKDQETFHKAHRFYNYVIRKWIDEMKTEG